ncbi:hypothetical protein E2P81_ATG04382 [Venturia nashicola]|nr:hypothetical protein E2P81_ATG04382 [Venturia nashicola]
MAADRNTIRTEIGTLVFQFATIIRQIMGSANRAFSSQPTILVLLFTSMQTLKKRSAIAMRTRTSHQRRSFEKPGSIETFAGPGAIFASGQYPPFHSAKLESSWLRPTVIIMPNKPSGCSEVSSLLMTDGAPVSSRLP